MRKWLMVLVMPVEDKHVDITQLNRAAAAAAAAAPLTGKCTGRCLNYSKPTWFFGHLCKLAILRQHVDER
jgi:hypothetical protein